MKVLAFDGSTEALSVAYLDTERADDVREHFEIAPREHARRLLPAAERLLAESGVALADLDGLVFARGPGAFTGLRIAAGLVQGLAIGAGLPVVGVSTLAALARRAFVQLPGAAYVQVVQDARMGEVYIADFGRETLPVPITAERVVAPDAWQALSAPASAVAIAGNGWHLVAGAALPADDLIVPHAGDVAVLGADALAAGQGGPAASATPVYVRDDVARRPKTA